MVQTTEKKIVFPGELLWDRPVNAKGTFVSGGKTYCSVLAFLSDDRVMPLRGFYDPQPGDAVIGYVSDVKFAGYNVEIFQPFQAFIFSKDLRFEYDVGNVLIAKIKEVDESKSAILEYPKQLKDGRMLNVEPVKVPRLVGKKNSMINTIRDLTGSEVYVGANGVVWFTGKNSNLVIKAISMIQEEAHTHGLTERVVKFLCAETGTASYVPRIDEVEERPPRRDYREHLHSERRERERPRYEGRQERHDSPRR